jgi:hypothetical protein
MNIKHIAASIAALTILAGGPSIAFATNILPSDPVALSDVNIQPNGDSDGFGPGFASVDFKNTNKVAATEVVFELDVNGAKVDRFKDVGSFAPGVTIRHAFLDTSDNADAKVNIVKVKFADGSAWVPTTITADDDQ